MDAVSAELVGFVGGEFGPLVADDFSFFTEGAGEDVYVGAEFGGFGDEAACPDGFVVGVCVDEEDAGSGEGLGGVHSFTIGDAHSGAAWGLSGGFPGGGGG